MKRAIVTMDYKPDVGGIAEYWSNIFEFLPKGDFVLVAPLQQGVQYNDIASVIRVPFLYKYIWPKWLRLLSELKVLIRRENIDHIVVGQILPVGTVALLLKKMGYISSFSVSCHSMDIAHISGHKKILAKYIFKNAQHVFVNSKFTKNLVKSYNIKSSIISIVYPAPKNLPVSKNNMRLDSGIGDDIVLLSVGRLVRRKGIDKVLSVLPRLWQDYSNLHYIIIGDGEDKDYLQNMIKNLPQDKQSYVRMLGRLSDEELSDWYNVADIFVLPSHNINGDVEGFGIVNLEASLNKLPLIVGQDGGVPETVLHNITGYSIDGNNENDLIDALEKLLKNPEKRTSMGETGYDFAKNFSWQKSAEVIIRNI